MSFFIVDVSEVRIGAPKVTPSAYKETVQPAWLTLTPKSSEIIGRRPTEINSVVPIANALIASARRAK